MRYVLPILVFLAGCCSPEIEFKRPIDTMEPWDMSYLIDLSPKGVSIAELTSRAAMLEEHYFHYAQVNGVIWPPTRSDPAYRIRTERPPARRRALFRHAERIVLLMCPLCRKRCWK